MKIYIDPYDIATISLYDSLIPEVVFSKYVTDFFSINKEYMPSKFLAHGFLTKFYDHPINHD